MIKRIIKTDLEVIIEDFGEAGMVGTIEGIPGLVVQATTEEEILKEINISLVALLNYNLKLYREKNNDSQIEIS